jgi:phospholipid/cholesterol/gamma-HCH transport system permease protein
MGDWTLQYAEGQKVEDILTALSRFSRDSLIILDSSGLNKWDSALMVFLLEFVKTVNVRSLHLDISGLPKGVLDLINLASEVPERKGSEKKKSSNDWLTLIGNAGGRLIQDGLRLTEFLGDSANSFRGFLFGRARFRSIDFWLQVQECGPSALPIVTLISLLVGLILAFVGAVQLALFGAQLYIADLVVLGMMREMGALMTAVIMSGRSGAAFAAQIGTMNVNLEISALKVMGFPPMDFLVLPRMLALVIVMPLLCIYSDLLGVIGGGLVSVAFFDIPVTQFLHRTAGAVHLADFFIGMFKATIFGALIALAGCARGMQCGRTASSVGDAATSSVVTAIVFIVVADSVITLVCDRLHI